MTTRQLVRTALFAALTAVGAFLKILLGPSAITLQFFFTAMAGCLLGSGCGALSQLIYVALGLLGLPVFTAGGGFSYVLHPTFGFLLGLIPAAWVIGRLAREHPLLLAHCAGGAGGTGGAVCRGAAVHGDDPQRLYRQGHGSLRHFVGGDAALPPRRCPENSGDGSADAAHPPDFG